MPVSIPVTAAGMNYASVVFSGFATISVVWYAVRGRKTFKGPEEVIIDGVGTNAGSGPTSGLSSTDEEMAVKKEAPHAL